jgi:hypothetical protein
MVKREVYTASQLYGDHLAYLFAQIDPGGVLAQDLDCSL